MTLPTTNVKRLLNALNVNVNEIAGTLSGSQYPNGGVLREEYGAVRLSPGHAHFLGVTRVETRPAWKRDPRGNATRVETRPVPHLCGLNRPVPCGGNAP